MSEGGSKCHIWHTLTREGWASQSLGRYRPSRASRRCRCSALSLLDTMQSSQLSFIALRDIIAPRVQHYYYSTCTCTQIQYQAARCVRSVIPMDNAYAARLAPCAHNMSDITRWRYCFERSHASSAAVSATFASGSHVCSSSYGRAILVLPAVDLFRRPRSVEVPCEMEIPLGYSL